MIEKNNRGRGFDQKIGIRINNTLKEADFKNQTGNSKTSSSDPLRRREKISMRRRREPMIGFVDNEMPRRVGRGIGKLKEGDDNGRNPSFVDNGCGDMSIDKHRLKLGDVESQSAKNGFGHGPGATCELQANEFALAGRRRKMSGQIDVASGRSECHRFGRINIQSRRGSEKFSRLFKEGEFSARLLPGIAV